MEALRQMIVLLLLMMTGLVAAKVRLLEQKSIKAISGLVVNVANPAMILASAAGAAKSIDREQLATAIPAAVASFVFLILASLVVPRMFRIPDKDRGIYKAMTAFNNMGFMGLPIIQSLYGEAALLYASVFLLFYNVLIYTYGVYVLGGQQENSKETLRKIINPGVGAAVLAIVCVLAGISVPGTIVEVFDDLGALTAPLSMMCIGASMLGTRPSELFLSRRILLFCGVKLLFFPIILLTVSSAVIQDTLLLGVIMVTTGTPIGSMNSMLAEEYSQNVEEVNRCVAVSTVFSVFTIPILNVFLNYLLTII